jgi:hypothetical protein
MGNTTHIKKETFTKWKQTERERTNRKKNKQ